MTTHNADDRKKKAKKDAEMAVLKPEFEFHARDRRPESDDYEANSSPMAYNRVPVVPLVTERGMLPTDIYSRDMLANRVIRITGPIDDGVAQRVIAELEFLDENNHDNRDIELRINSPGGVVTAGLAIYDKMQALNCDVRTVVEGQAASMAAVLLTAGAPGKRSAMPHARIMIHQPSGGTIGQITDMKIHVEEGERLKHLLTQIMADHTGTSFDDLIAAKERDNFLSPEGARDMGIIDKIEEPKKLAPYAKRQPGNQNNKKPGAGPARQLH